MTRPAEECPDWIPFKTCQQGHPLTPENIYMQPKRGGHQRVCRECKREQARRYKRRLRGEHIEVNGMEAKGYLRVEPFRDALRRAMREDPHLTLAEIGARMEWYRNNRRLHMRNQEGDESRVSRTFGLRPRKDCPNEWVKPANAALLLRAIHRDPWEFGL